MTVYFAHACGGGPIKIGASKRVNERIAGIATWIPQGVEMIVEIPGHFGRESFLKHALAPWKIKGEWLNSCVPVWRVISEAYYKGDLPWVPSDNFNNDARQIEIARIAELLADFNLPLFFGAYGRHFLGKLQFLLQLKNRDLPDWILEAHDRSTILKLCEVAA